MNTTAADIVLAIAVGLAMVGVFGTLVGLLLPWWERRRQDRENMRKRERIAKRLRGKP
jgi:hypothetical protein